MTFLFVREESRLKQRASLSGIKSIFIITTLLENIFHPRTRMIVLTLDALDVMAVY